MQSMFQASNSIEYSIFIFMLSQDSSFLDAHGCIFSWDAEHWDPDKVQMCIEDPSIYLINLLIKIKATKPSC